MEALASWDSCPCKKRKRHSSSLSLRMHRGRATGGHREDTSTVPQVCWGDETRWPRRVLEHRNSEILSQYLGVALYGEKTGFGLRWA